MSAQPSAATSASAVSAGTARAAGISASMPIAAASLPGPRLAHTSSLAVERSDAVGGSP